MMLGREAVCDVARLVNLTALDGNVRPESSAQRLAQSLGPIHDEQVAALGIHTTFDEIVEQGLHRRGVLRRPFDDTQRVLLPGSLNPDSANHQQMLVQMQTVDLDGYQV